MQTNRRKKLESVIREELSKIIPQELKDPRVVPLIITAVDITEDGSRATLFMTLFKKTLENNPQEALKVQNCLNGLSSASGYLKNQLSKRLQIRHIPDLFFREDRGFENAARVHELLQQ